MPTTKESEYRRICDQLLSEYETIVKLDDNDRDLISTESRVADALKDNPGLLADLQENDYKRSAVRERIRDLHEHRDRLKPNLSC